MLKTARILSGAFALAALGALFLAPARGRDDDDDKEAPMKTAAAKDAVLKLVGDLGGKEDDVKKEAEAIAKMHDIKYVMNQFKPREKGGLGVGAKPDAIKPDAIELKLLALGKKALPAADLAAQKADLQKVAQVSEAIAFIAPSYAENEGRKGQEVKDWVKYCEEMRKESKDLVVAVQGGDPKMVLKAANTLNGSCDACHTAFRDK